MVVDTNSYLAGFFSQGFQGLTPSGDPTFIAIMALLFFMTGMWLMGISSVSVLLLGVLFLGALHYMFGGFFTIIFWFSFAALSMFFALAVLRIIFRQGA